MTPATVPKRSSKANSTLEENERDGASELSDKSWIIEFDEFDECSWQVVAQGEDASSIEDNDEEDSRKRRGDDGDTDGSSTSLNMENLEILESVYERSKSEDLQNDILLPVVIELNVNQEVTSSVCDDNNQDFGDSSPKTTDASSSTDDTASEKSRPRTEDEEWKEARRVKRKLRKENKENANGCNAAPNRETRAIMPVISDNNRSMKGLCIADSVVPLLNNRQLTAHWTSWFLDNTDEIGRNGRTLKSSPYLLPHAQIPRKFLKPRFCQNTNGNERVFERHNSRKRVRQ